VELVINGDFLDFVQAEPWSGSDLEATGEDEIPLCFTAAQSMAKLESIHCAHTSVFEALTAFSAAHPDNAVTILPGNHDADFYFEPVRRRVQELAAGSGFFLDPVYRPGDCPSVWIEHGHQSDPVNNFFWRKQSRWSAATPPVFPDLDGVPRLFECVGTRFMLKFMNGLDCDYPFVDNVKPFSRFVRIFLDSASIRGLRLKAVFTLGRMLKFVYSTVMDHSEDVLGIESQVQDVTFAMLAARLKTLPKARITAFSRRLAECGFTPEMGVDMYFQSPATAKPVLEFLASNPEPLEEVEVPTESFMGEGQAGTLTLAHGFSVDETAELIKTANAALAQDGVALTVMGHTHEPVKRLPARAYINTGSWTRYYRFTAPDTTTSWDVLKRDSYLTFPYELNYVEIVPGAVESAQLVTYKERHA
jgi:UDP-2,3-diacylglucosamine pyrophosphatase LpxH